MGVSSASNSTTRLLVVGVTKKSKGSPRFTPSSFINATPPTGIVAGPMIFNSADNADWHTASHSRTTFTAVERRYIRNLPSRLERQQKRQNYLDEKLAPLLPVDFAHAIRAGRESIA